MLVWVPDYAPAFEKLHPECISGGRLSLQLLSKKDSLTVLATGRKHPLAVLSPHYQFLSWGSMRVVILLTLGFTKSLHQRSLHWASPLKLNKCSFFRSGNNLFVIKWEWICCFLCTFTLTNGLNSFCVPYGWLSVIFSYFFENKGSV